MASQKDNKPLNKQYGAAYNLLWQEVLWQKSTMTLQLIHITLNLANLPEVNQPSNLTRVKT